MKPKKISVNPLYQRHPRSINIYTDMKSALGALRAFDGSSAHACTLEAMRIQRFYGEDVSRE
jgi:hypothetical protein